jgi:hypothetical protein
MEIPAAREELIAEMAAFFKDRLTGREDLMQNPLGVFKPAKHQG